MCDCLAWHHPVWALVGKRAGVAAVVAWGVFCALREGDPVLARLPVSDRLRTLALGLGLKPAQVALVVASLQHSCIVDAELQVASEWRLNRTPDAKPDGASENRTLAPQEPDAEGQRRPLSTNPSSVRSWRKYWRDKEKGEPNENRTQPDTRPKSASLSLVSSVVHSMKEEGMKVENARARAQPELPLRLPPPQLVEPPKPGEGNARTRGSRLAESWRPGPAEIAFARGLGLDPDIVFDEFHDWWIAASGARATKLDWSATWRTWCRREAKDGRRTIGGSGPVGDRQGGSITARALSRVVLRGDR